MRRYRSSWSKSSTWPRSLSRNRYAYRFSFVFSAQYAIRVTF